MKPKYTKTKVQRLQFDPGMRVRVALGSCKLATVITEKQFIAEYPYLMRSEFLTRRRQYLIIYLKYDNGVVDWEYTHQCKLTATQELANEAGR